MKNGYPITEDQVRFYEENGFIQLHDVLGGEEIQRMRVALDRAIDDVKRHNLNLGPRTDAGYTKVFLQMVNLWERYPVVEEYVHDRRIAEIARRLTRAPYVRLWHDQGLVKFPRDSKATAWHQDTVYWPMNEYGGLSCWMALDDVTVDNGCMWFIPGSHKLGPLEPVDLGNATDDSILSVLPPEFRDRKPVSMEMKAGSCTFHNGLTLHYAGPNVSDRLRRAMVTIFIPAGTTYKRHEHLVGDRGNLMPGEEFHGPLFPVLSRAVDA
jgi:ectoine hydroxylase-related dioxygenase (phytanoyl-CoA dioxygenase family)